MKYHRNVAVWRVIALCGALLASVGCGGPVDAEDKDEGSGGAGNEGATASSGAENSSGGADTGSGSGGADTGSGSGGVDTGSGSGGADTGSGPGGSGTGSDIGPTSCLPLFTDACTPQINFNNTEPDGRGAVFNQVIPDPVATMQDVACTVCSILFRHPDEIPQEYRHTTINLTIKDHNAVASASGNSIDFDVKYIEQFTPSNATLVEFRGVLVHESTHLYQYYGNAGLGEGMADFVRIRVGLYEPGRRTPGGSWTDPYTTSGFFFSWLAGPGVYHADGREPHDIDIGYLINKRIGEQGPDGVPSLFVERFGVDVETLWNEYQSAIQ